MEGRLFYAPIGQSPQRVLDIATGTGIWAIDFGNASSVSLTLVFANLSI